MIILKFGGSSVSSPELLQVIQNIISKKEKYVIVVSAFSNITDKLINLADLFLAQKKYEKEFTNIRQTHLEIIQKFNLSKNNQKKVEKKFLEKLNNLKNILNRPFDFVSLRSGSSKDAIKDEIISFGEQFSGIVISEILSRAIVINKIPNTYLDAQTLIKTDDNFGNAQINFLETNKNLKNYFKKNKNQVTITTGFIASTDQNKTTTLGRGGSDYTASIIGAALGAEKIEIWTDVSGVMSADPRKVQKAFTIPHLTYEEAMEMSYFGAKVIHPATMKPAQNARIPIYIKNTFAPLSAFTEISNKKKESNFPIKGVSSINNIALLRLEGVGMIRREGISGRLFSALGKNKINIILISQASSEYSICFAIEKEKVKQAKTAIRKEFQKEIQNKNLYLFIENNLSIISIAGENMRSTPGIAGTLFSNLGRDGINIIAFAQGSSEINISFIVSCIDEVKTLNVVHNSFFLSEYKTLNVFLVGAGLIGSTLLKQIQANEEYLKKTRKTKINLIGIGNINKQIIRQNGIDLDNWQKILKQSREKADINKYILEIKKLNLPHSILIDCTASARIAAQYAKILDSNISIVTPNKKANSSTFKNYQKLKEITARPSVEFLYETNVGAGLPVISALRDLLSAGDKIIKIEAILSGTLSYIFNNFSENRNFSEVVRLAQKKGYTEPDPRDDLDGMDVARKILILARETGLALELRDVQVQSLLNKECLKAKSIEEFFKVLAKTQDEYFRNLIKEAKEKKKKLRYIAKLQNKIATVALEMVDQNHPFYNMSGSDNIVSFTTKHYKNTPLVIKGPGAGAEVTAAGVYADILKVFR